MLKDYFHAAYLIRIISESNLSVDDSHSLQPKNYLHYTYSAGSISESDSLVNWPDAKELDILLEEIFKLTNWLTTG